MCASVLVGVKDKCFRGSDLNSLETKELNISLSIRLSFLVVVNLLCLPEEKSFRSPDP